MAGAVRPGRQLDRAAAEVRPGDGDVREIHLEGLEGDRPAVAHLRGGDAILDERLAVGGDLDGARTGAAVVFVVARDARDAREAQEASVRDPSQMLHRASSRVSR
jgi:hypothetical protein